VCVNPCTAAPDHCVLAWQVISARWFAKLVVTVGPLLMWLPLLAHARYHARLPELSSWVVLAAIAWLGLSMPLRFTTLVVNWDPSGHVLVLGLQLVPMWLFVEHAARDVPLSKQPFLVGAEALGLVLASVTLGTAAFFHNPSEISSALVVVTAVFVAAQRVLPVTVLRQMPASTLKSTLVGWLQAAAVVCAVCGALVPFVMPGVTFASLLPFALHDAVLFAFMRFVVFDRMARDRHSVL